MGTGVRDEALATAPGHRTHGSLPDDHPTPQEPTLPTPTEDLSASRGDVVDAADDRFAATVDRLVALARIRSISAAGHDPAAVRAAATLSRDLLREVGLDDARLVTVGDAHPYVLASDDHAGPRAPTVLLYAHHDVQPVGTPDRWTTPPFEPVERDGRLYGRGTADDKAGVLVHVAAIEAWRTARGRLPVNVKVVIEGEEEIGSPHLDRFLDEFHDELRADVIVLTDLPNWQIGWPALTVALRGMGECSVRVRTLAQPVHSGMYGGPVPDALTATVQLLATLHDRDGEIAVAGFDAGRRRITDAERARLELLDIDVDDIRHDARMLDGVRYVGDPTVGRWQKVWYRPTITPIGMDVPPTVEAGNTLLADVTTKLSCRFAPDQDPEDALAALAAHLRRHAPHGAVVDVTLGHRSSAWTAEPQGPAWDAAVAAMTAGYGRAPAAIGCGGSIPFVRAFGRAFDDAPCLLTGIEDPATNAHGEDESLHLGDFRNAVVSEVHLLDELARRLRPAAVR